MLLFEANSLWMPVRTFCFFPLRFTILLNQGNKQRNETTAGLQLSRTDAGTSNVLEVGIFFKIYQTHGFKKASYYLYQQNILCF